MLLRALVFSAALAFVSPISAAELKSSPHRPAVAAAKFGATLTAMTRLNNTDGLAWTLAAFLAANKADVDAGAEDFKAALGEAARDVARGKVGGQTRENILLALNMPGIKAAVPGIPRFARALDFYHQLTHTDAHVQFQAHVQAQVEPWVRYLQDKNLAGQEARVLPNLLDVGVLASPSPDNSYIDGFASGRYHDPVRLERALSACTIFALQVPALKISNQGQHAYLTAMNELVRRMTPSDFSTQALKVLPRVIDEFGDGRLLKTIVDVGFEQMEEFGYSHVIQAFLQECSELMHADDTQHFGNLFTRLYDISMDKIFIRHLNLLGKPTAVVQDDAAEFWFLSHLSSRLNQAEGKKYPGDPAAALHLESLSPAIQSAILSANAFQRILEAGPAEPLADRTYFTQDVIYELGEILHRYETRKDHSEIIAKIEALRKYLRKNTLFSKLFA